MLASERGYLLSEGNMQDEVRAGLEETLPDIRRYRAFPDARIWLNPDKIPPPGHIRYAPPELRDRAEWSAPPVGDDAALPESHVEEAIVELVEEAELDDVVLRDDYPEGVASKETAAFHAEPLQPEEVPELSDDEAGVPEPAVVEPATELELCRQCGTDLPVGAAFCPFCGTRLSPQTCEACGAKLESAWGFCASCGAPRFGRSTDPA